MITTNIVNLNTPKSNLLSCCVNKLNNLYGYEISKRIQTQEEYNSQGKKTANIYTKENREVLFRNGYRKLISLENLLEILDELNHPYWSLFLTLTIKKENLVREIKNVLGGKKATNFEEELRNPLINKVKSLLKNKADVVYYIISDVGKNGNLHFHVCFVIIPFESQLSAQKDTSINRKERGRPPKDFFKILKEISSPEFIKEHWPYGEQIEVKLWDSEKLRQLRKESRKVNNPALLYMLKKFHDGSNKVELPEEHFKVLALYKRAGLIRVYSWFPEEKVERLIEKYREKLLARRLSKEQLSKEQRSKEQPSKAHSPEDHLSNTHRFPFYRLFYPIKTSIYPELNAGRINQRYDEFQLSMLTVVLTTEQGIIRAPP